MRNHSHAIPPSFHRCAWFAALLLAMPVIAVAQQHDAADTPTGNHHSHASSADNSAHATQKPAAAAHKDSPAATPTAHGMQHGDMHDMHDMESAPTQGRAPPSDMKMGRMQGGSAPPGARSPDYSEGIDYGPMQGMEMLDNAPLGMLRVDQLEAFHGIHANGQAWEVEGWYGNDVDKLWLRSEGERSGGTLEDASLEAFWNRTIAPFWSTQVGVRHDFGEGPSRTWAAIGLQGLAPYWFELEATVYAGSSGRTAARLRAEYELLLTQRLILQPEAEINIYGKNDPALRIGSGISDVQFGLRLRYEVTRQFAPYVGIDWNQRVGTTADYARADLQSVFDRRVVAGVRFWF